MKRSGRIQLYFSVAFLSLWICTALLSSILSSEKPLVFKKNNQYSFPAIYDPHNLDYKELDSAFMIWPLVPFKASKMDMQNTGLQKPGAIEIRKAGEFVHILGTDHLGRDVMAGLIKGSFLAFQIVMLSLLISTILGLGLGMLMGYFGDEGLKISSEKAFILLSVFLLALFHLNIVASQAIISIMTWLILFAIAYFLIFKIRKRQKPGFLRIPIDLITSRAIEVFDSIPKIVLFIAIFSGLVPSIAKVIFLIALISWPEIAKITRAETLNEKNKSYIESGRALGFSNFRLLFIHILPNITPSLLTLLAFSAGYILLMESSLSFLGMGAPPDTITWGRMLAMAKNHLSSWWLVLFPGFFIFATVYSLNTLGRYLGNKIQYQKEERLLI